MAMRTVLRCVIALTACVAAIAPALARPLAIVDVTILPMDGAVRLPHRTVLIDKGRITRIAPAGKVRIPANAVRVSGRNRYLMPGLSDMHAHVFVGLKSQPTPDEQRLALLSYLATGITIVRDPSGGPSDLALRDMVAAGRILGPRMFAASPILEGRMAVWPDSVRVEQPEQADAVIGDFKAAGYDYVKIYHTLSKSVFDAVMAAARRHKIKVIGHVPFEVGVEQAIAGGMYSVEHLRGYDFDGMTPKALEKDGGRSPERMGVWLRMTDARMSRLADLTVRSGVWNTPTLSYIPFLADPSMRQRAGRDPAFGLLPPYMQAALGTRGVDAIFSPEVKAVMLEALPRQRAFLKRLHDRGAKLLIGTDSPIPYLVPGATAIDEIGQFVQAGISTHDALKAATTNAAASLGIAAQAGTVAVGKGGGLILLNADPLADPANLWKLEGVVIDGNWHPRGDLIREIGRLRAGMDKPRDTH
jgi:imidazolonepropionase-like amidohydrolase